MTYKEFLNAARKHLATCKVLRDILEESINTNNVDVAKNKQLTINLYYLSGYIIECSVKYGIYVCLDYDRNHDIMSLDTAGISFSRNIKHHRFDRYVDHLNRKISGITLIDNKAGISNEVKKLYNNWDAEVRYCYNEIPEKFKHCDEVNHVINFSYKAEEIFKYIRSNIR